MNGKLPFLFGKSQPADNPMNVFNGFYLGQLVHTLCKVHGKFGILCSIFKLISYHIDHQINFCLANFNLICPVYVSEGGKQHQKLKISCQVLIFLIFLSFCFLFYFFLLSYQLFFSHPCALTKRFNEKPSAIVRILRNLLNNLYF